MPLKYFLEFVNGESYLWNILIRNVDFRTKLKLGQINQRLSELVEETAEYELKRLKNKISDNKFM